MLCDGSPDPTNAGEINTYMSLWMEDLERADLDSVLEDSELTLSVSTHYEPLNRGPAGPILLQAIVFN